MQFQVSEITFDFADNSGTLSKDAQNDIIREVLGSIWEADDEDDLIEEITCATGYCVSSINYRHILRA